MCCVLLFIMKKYFRTLLKTAKFKQFKKNPEQVRHFYNVVH